MSVSLVVPCYQEEAALEAFANLLPRLGVGEIVFVDDGSTDATAERLAAIARADPRVKVETHGANRGVGAAMRTGLAAAKGEVVVVYDADRTYPPEDIPRLVAAVEAGADVATASPFAPGGSLPDVPALRRFLSRAAAWSYRVVLGRRARGISTFTCAFRAYGRPCVQGLVFTSDGFPAAGEILGRLLLGHADVVEVPSCLTARTAGASKMRAGRAALGHVKVLGRLLWRRVTRG